jgi:hypothetical protein
MDGFHVRNESISSDHEAMCKFPSRTASGYTRTRGFLRDSMTTGTQPSNYQPESTGTSLESVGAETVVAKLIEPAAADEFLDDQPNEAKSVTGAAAQ